MSIGHKIYNILKKFDIYAYNFNLHYKQETEFSTFCGIIFSISSITLMIIISISYSKKMIEGSNFSLVTNYIYSNDLNEIDLSSNPIMFGLASFEETHEINPEYVTIRVDRNVHIPYKNENGIYTIKRTSHSINLEKCTINSIGSYLNLYDKSNIEYSKFLCVKPNQNLKIKGHHGDLINESITLEIHLIRCENSTDNNNHCKSKEEIDKYLENLYVILVYVSKNIDHYNVSNPIYDILRADSFAVTLNHVKRYYYFFANETYISDNGLILNSNKKYDLFTYHHTQFDFEEEEKQLFYSKETLLEINFTCLELKTVYNRTYIKIQDVLSYLGGIFDIISTFFHFISQNFIKKCFITTIGGSLISSNVKTINLAAKNDSDNSNHNMLKIHHKFSGTTFALTKRMKIETVNICTLFNVNVKNNNILNLFNINDDEQKMMQTFEKKKKKLSFFIFYYFIPLQSLFHFKRFKTYILYKNIFQKMLSIDIFIPMLLHSYQSLNNQT